MVDLILDFNPTDAGSLEQGLSFENLLQLIMQNPSYKEIEHVLVDKTAQLGYNYHFIQDRLIQSEHKVDSGLDKLASVEGIFKFVQGILNGTTLISTSSSVSCKSAITYQKSGLNDSWTLVSSNFTVFGVLNAFEIFLDAPFHIYEVNNDCYDSLSEAGNVYDSYTAALKDPSYIQ